MTLVELQSSLGIYTSMCMVYKTQTCIAPIELRCIWATTAEASYTGDLTRLRDTSYGAHTLKFGAATFHVVEIMTSQDVRSYFLVTHKWYASGKAGGK